MSSFSLRPRLGAATMAELMRLHGLTARALRHYETRGLIEARRDRRNCRYYDADTRAEVRIIAALRAARIGLAEIDAVLVAGREGGEAQRTAMIAQTLERRREELKAEGRRLEEIAADLVPLAAEQAA